MNEILTQLHNAVAQDLLERVQSGQANAADLNVARAFLKDNGIDATLEASEPMANLAKTLPFNTEVA